MAAVIIILCVVVALRSETSLVKEEKQKRAEGVSKGDQHWTPFIRDNSLQVLRACGQVVS